MNQFRNIVAAAALAGFSLIAGFGVASSATGMSGIVMDAATVASPSQRIDAAFALVAAEAGEASSPTASRNGKGDLPVGLNCSAQRWPDISPDCLIVTGDAPKRPVRTVTIGYQDGPAGSVLIRLPAPQIATR